MSENKAAVEVKQEGEFKIKKPKNLGHISKSEPVKVDLTKPEATGEVVPDVVKVELPKEEIKKEDNAIPIGETKTVDVGEQTGDSVKVDEQVQESSETVEEPSPIQEITEEEKQEEVKEVTKQAQEAIRDEQVLGKPLPENIEKLVNFMEETGGSVEDYVA